MSRLAYLKNKIKSLDEAKRLVEMCRMQNKKVVFTNGCFDILHKGHVTYLAKAADLGNLLIVAINTDNSVRSLEKDVNRPINSEDARAFVLAGLGFVDVVLLFDENTPLNLVKELIPEVLVKGADYDPDQSDPNSKKYIVGSDVVRNAGGEVKTIDLEDGFSTTSIISKINK